MVNISENTSIDPLNMTITASQSLLLAMPAYVTLNYKLKRSALQLSGCDVGSLCFDCVYDLKIDVKDDCGNSMYAYSQDAVLPFDTACVNDSFTRNQVLLLPRGSYTIYKQLTVNKASIDQHADVYMRNNTCVKTVDEIYEDLLSQIDFSGCNITCQSCKDSLGTLEEYIEAQTSGLDLETLDEDSLIRKVTYAYRKLAEDCDDLCNDYSPCSAERVLLLQDVSPGGQYFEYTYDENGEAQVTDALSFGGGDGVNVNDPYKTNIRNWQNPAMVYCEENGDTSYIWYDGNMVKPNDAPLDVFLSNWRNSWADSLIKMHPEYCYYQWCIENTASHLYDLRAYKTETFAAAEADSLLNPVDATGVSYIHLLDPFFSGYGAPDLAAIKAKVEVYYSFNGVDYSMFDMAAIMANCPIAHDENELQTCLATNPFGSGTTAQKNKQWGKFPGLVPGC